MAALGQAAGDADRGVPGKGADLQGAARAGEAGQHRHQGALLGSDLHAGRVRPAGGGLGGQLLQQVIGPGAMRDDVVFELRAEPFASSGHSRRS